MARQPRIDYEGAWHHVMNRGRNRDIIFRDHKDQLAFLDELDNIVQHFGIEVHAYSLMPNHYHLLVRSPHGNLSAAMQSLGRDYSQRFNLRHGGDGALFRGRFKSQLVEDGRYLKHLVAYIHLNPLRANLVSRIYSDGAWTSHRAYTARETAPPWLCRKFFLKVFKSADLLEAFALSLHRGAEEWPPEMLLTTGWFSSAGKKSDKYHAEAAKTVTAEQLLADIGTVTSALQERLMTGIAGPKGNPERRFAVWVLRKKTFMTHAQIGALLQMSANQVARDLARSREKINEFKDWMNAWESLYPAKVLIGEI